MWLRPASGPILRPAAPWPDTHARAGVCFEHGTVLGGEAAGRVEVALFLHLAIRDRRQLAAAVLIGAAAALHLLEPLDVDGAQAAARGDLSRREVRGTY